MLNLENHSKNLQSLKMVGRSCHFDPAPDTYREGEKAVPVYWKTSKLWDKLAHYYPKFSPLGGVRGGFSPQNQNAYGKCLNKSNKGIRKSDPKSALISAEQKMFSTLGGRYPENSGERGSILSLPGNLEMTTQFTPPRGEKKGVPTLIVLNGKHPKPNEKSNTDITTKCRILALRADCFFVVASALTIVNSEIAFGFSENNGFNINKNRIDKTLKPKCQSTNSKNTFCNLKTGWKEETSTISQHPTRSGARFQTSPSWGERLTAPSTDGDGQAKGVKREGNFRIPSPQKNRTQVLIKN